MAKNVNEWLYSLRARPSKQPTIVRNEPKIEGDERFELDYANSDDLRSLNSGSDFDEQDVKRKRKKKYAKFNDNIDLHKDVHLEVS